MNKKVCDMNLLKLNVILTTSFALSLGACTSKKFDAPMVLGGQFVSAKKLNLGYDTYQNYCMQCHGVNGDGKGPAAQGSAPLPRNFQQGLYKFASVPMGELPTDEDLKRTIKYGLNGTPMLPWDISEERLDAVVQYIKTFSPVWKEQKPGTPVAMMTKDPFGPERAAEAIALGKKVYHGMAQCFSCHPAYASLEEISAYSKELTGNEIKVLRENPHLSVLQDSSYGHKMMPPDYTKNPIKSDGNDLAALNRVLGIGINGTTMPAWQGLLSATGNQEESDIRQWALAYYVNSLYKLRYDTKARQAFFEELNSKRGLAR